VKVAAAQELRHRAGDDGPPACRQTQQAAPTTARVAM
jgi:hypothetical protein